VATVLLVLGASLAGGALASAPNGESAKTVSQILADMQKAVARAHTVHIAGSGTSGGSPIALDLRLDASRGGEGTIAEGGLSFKIIRIGGKAYFNAATSFWKREAGKTAAQLFAGKWIEASATSGQLASLTPITDLAAIMQQILSGHGKLAKGATATIDGQPAFSLVDTTEGGTLWIAADGTPYPLELTPKKGNTGSILFEAWDQPFGLKAPSNPLDFTQALKG
jgi:hypothetical protein